MNKTPTPKKPKKDVIWDYFSPKENFKKFKCVRCKKFFCATTTNLKRHVETEHKDVFIEYISSKEAIEFSEFESNQRKKKRF